MSELKFKSDAEYSAWLDMVMSRAEKHDIVSSIACADKTVEALQERTPESPFSDSSRHEQYSRHLPNIDRLPAELANAISNALQGVPGMLGAAWYGSRPEDLDNHTAIVRDVIASYLGANEAVEEPGELAPPVSQREYAVIIRGEQAALDKATQQAPLTKRLIAALHRLMLLHTDGCFYSRRDFDVSEGIPALIEARKLLSDIEEPDDRGRVGCGNGAWLPPEQAHCDEVLAKACKVLGKSANLSLAQWGTVLLEIAIERITSTNIGSLRA